MTVYGPLGTAVDKALSGTSTTLFFTGDSTVWGACDGGSTLVSNGGWPRRLGVAIGQYCNTTVKYQVYNPSTRVYSSPATVYTGTGTHSITVINGGISSQYIPTLTNYINNYNLISSAAATADCAFIGTGINDARFAATPTDYVPDYLAFINLIQSRCTTATTCVTTQNVLSSAAMAGRYARYTSNYNALLTALVGDVMPTAPALQYSDVHSTWTLDTQQAYGNVYQPLLMADSVHPNAYGYTAQSNFMAVQLLVAPTGPTITTTTLDTIIRGIPFSQTLTATGTVTAWSIASGTIPTGLALNASTGTISGTPNQYGGTYTFTVRASNDNGFNDQTFSGAVDANSIPFVPKGQANFRNFRLGYYYPITTKVKTAGTFRPIIVRD